MVTARSCRRWGHKKKLIWRNQYQEKTRCQRCRRYFIQAMNLLTSADRLLKKYYGPLIRKQLNRTVNMFECFDASKKFSGRRVEFPEIVKFEPKGGFLWKLKNWWNTLMQGVS